jgi:hypothetical protein
VRFPLPVRTIQRTVGSVTALHKNLKQQSSDKSPMPRQKASQPCPSAPSGQRLSVPAERLAGGGPGRAARLGAGRLGARVRVVGGQHHAARVLHLHRQPRMSLRWPQNKDRDQHGPARGEPVTSSAARSAPSDSLPAVGAWGTPAPPAGGQINIHQRPRPQTRGRQISIH